MDLSAVTIVNEPLVRATHAEVDDLESFFGVRFPMGYREYVTILGEGIFAGYYIRIYPPWRILHGCNNVNEWRKLVDEFWFWDAGRHVLTKSEVLECIILGDTMNGDHIVFHPRNPDDIFVLPLEEEEIYGIRGGVFAALDWFCASGVLTEPVTERDFEPFDSRVTRK